MESENPKAKNAIKSVRHFINKMQEKPGELDGLVFESLIRDLISKFLTPMNDKSLETEVFLREIIKDHNIISQKINDSDKRLH